MTSSSIGVEIGLALALLAGCEGVEVFETQVVVLAETQGCRTAAARSATVNAYRVVLFELVDEPTEGDTRPPCASCFEDGTCPIRELACKCGRHVPPLTLALNRELSDLRFDALSPDARYCMAIAAFDVPGLAAPEGAAVECACDFGGAELAGTSRVCGVNPFPARVGENAAFVPISADCPPDGCPRFEVDSF